MPDRSQRTEAPTPKRKREAREKGQIAKSPEIAAWGGALAALFLLRWSMSTGAARFEGLMAHMGQAVSRPTESGALRFLGEAMAAGLLTLAPVALGLMALGVTIEMAQVASKPSLKRLKPDFSRLNPAKGFKRLFSKRALWETTKGLLKLVLVAGVTYPVLRSMVSALAAGGLQAGEAAKVAGSGAMTLLRNAAAAGLALAVADYVMQRRRVMAEMRMTRQEVREELRQSEGDPHVKHAIRSRQAGLSRNRMLSAVATADVVLVNPTHYAVALRYEVTRGAPEVVAAGAGVVAASIRAEAEEHRVPIVEDPPLTRVLHRVCEVGDTIPGPLYEAVAGVLAFVYGLRRRGTIGGVHPSTRRGPLPEEPAGRGHRRRRGNRRTPQLAGATVDG